LNNNRNNNNRRGRGRNNNRNQGGNPNQQNRIDNRARGNAPQLLDKYKKLAQDAYHNGDRVQQEYYLQFADHYFRVIADNKARQDEARAKRQEERGDSSDAKDFDGDDNDGDDRQNNRRGRGRNNDSDGDRQNQNGRGRGRSNQRDDNSQSHVPSEEGEQKAEGEQGDNPFTRETKRPRKPRAQKPAEDAGEIDAAALPPAFGDASEEAPAPKPKRAPRRRKAADDGETAEAAS